MSSWRGAWLSTGTTLGFDDGKQNVCSYKLTTLQQSKQGLSLLNVVHSFLAQVVRNKNDVYLRSEYLLHYKNMTITH